MRPEVSGNEPGQRQLNGPQTTGREYRNLSQPSYSMAEDDDVEVPLRDGVNLLVDVHRPSESGKFPVLIAASPYPRQIQNMGAPAGFIEAGASDFFVPRGYVHVIANLRGTGGSGGTYTYSDSQERRDMYDLVECKRGLLVLRCKNSVLGFYAWTNSRLLSFGRVLIDFPTLSCAIRKS
jgi:uncharacterized protein